MTGILHRCTYLSCLWLALLAAGVLFGQSARTGGAQSLEREFQAALDAQERGDLRTAESMLVSLRKRSPGNFAIDESRGILLASESRFSDALPVLQAAAREAPASDVAHTNLGAAYFHVNRMQESLAEFTTAVRLNPRNATALKSLGQVWMELHKPERAAESYAAALALDPSDDDVRESCAQARVAAGQLDAARDLLTGMPGVDKSAAAQSLLGEIEEKRGDFMAAANHYGLAAQLDPTEQNAWAVGVEFLRHWTFSAAVKVFEAYVPRFPASTRMHLGLGAAYFGDANYPQAINVFADLLKEDPNNALYAEFLGMSCNALMRQKQPRCLALVGYAQSHPRDARAATYAAASLKSQDAEHPDLDLIRKLLSAAIAVDPNLAEAQYEMGVLRQDENTWKDSIPYLERAIAIKPDYAQAHYRLALAYWRTGRKEEGQQQMELQKKYSQQEQKDLDQRLRQIVTFRMNSHD